MPVMLPQWHQNTRYFHYILSRYITEHGEHELSEICDCVCSVQGGRAQRRQRQAEESLGPYIGRVKPGKTSVICHKCCDTMICGWKLNRQHIRWQLFKINFFIHLLMSKNRLSF